MAETIYRDRKAVSIENELVRVTVLAEGGHIAAILHKHSGVNPLWTPPWNSIEPSTWDPQRCPEYGDDSESRLLSGLMGHNVCIDLFGGPSKDEALAGIPVHGEASVLPYEITATDDTMNCACRMPMSQILFRRALQLDGESVLISESVENLSPWDRPIAWQQHVTLGPPFLQHGHTQFDVTATASRTYEGDFGDLFKSGVEFFWPHAPLADGGEYDLRTFTERRVSAGYTAHLLDRGSDEAHWSARSADLSVEFGYRWRRADFPWLGIWEENRSRQNPPWNGETVARGMEFGVSPQPESRRSMIGRGSMFDTPSYRWLPARGTLTADYSAYITARK
ncbi:MAG: hypothetical protein H7Y20_18055 [Bryobacteraceae bacterium]|nr:hypothetical protein [Bryobacteraceae bacterium]